MKTLTTLLNAETFRQFEIAAAERNMSPSQALCFIAENGINVFLALKGGVHHG